MKRGIMTLGCWIPLAACAANWWGFGESGEEGVFLDRHSVRQEQGSVIAWSLHNFQQRRPDRACSRLQSYRIDCQVPAYFILSESFYRRPFGGGSIVRSYIYPEPAGEGPIQAAAGTALARMLEFACHHPEPSDQAPAAPTVGEPASEWADDRRLDSGTLCLPAAKEAAR